MSSVFNFTVFETINKYRKDQNEKIYNRMQFSLKVSNLYQFLAPLIILLLLSFPLLHVPLIFSFDFLTYIDLVA